MSEIDYVERRIHARIVYYGGAACGKSTNLQVLHRRTHPSRRGTLVSVDSTQNRTIVLDLLTIRTPAFGGFETNFELVAVPGQRMFTVSRKLLLEDADGVVFVANSAADRWQETVECMREMNEFLISNGLDPKAIPVVVQFNKQDLPDVTPLEAMERTLNARQLAGVPATAKDEKGVSETLEAALLHTFASIVKEPRLERCTRDAKSVQEWTERAMHVLFDWTVVDGEPVYRKSWSLKSKTGAGTEGPRSKSAPPPRAFDTRPEDLWRMAVRVRSPVKSAPATPPAPGNSSGLPSVENLVESYSEAAAKLSRTVQTLNERCVTAERRFQELGASIAAAEALLDGVPTEDALRNVIEQIAFGLGADRCSLSLMGHDGELESSALFNLSCDPILDYGISKGVHLAETLLKETEPVVFERGKSDPADRVLEQMDDCSALVAIPLSFAGPPQGLLCFYLPREATIPRQDALSHLKQIAKALVLALRVSLPDQSPAGTLL